MSQSQVDLLRITREAIQNNDYMTAMNAMQQLVAYDKESGNATMEMMHRSNLALMQNRLGFSDEALVNLEQALVLAKEQGSHASESGILGNMGGILREVGQLEAARKRLNEAVIVARQIGDRRGEGSWLHQLALIHDDTQQYKQAQHYHEQAVSISRELQDKRSLTYRLASRGSSYLQQDRLAEGIACYEEALQLDRDLNDMHGLLVHLSILGNAYVGRYQDSPNTDWLTVALAYYREARHIAREQQNILTEAKTLANMGIVYCYQENPHEALRCFGTAGDYFVQLKMPDQNEALADWVAYAKQLAR